MNIAYWDTEQGAQTPAILGQIKGTPTIKFIKPHPKKNKKGQHKKKIVLDYNGERKAKDMKEYAEMQMPSALELINGEDKLKKFEEKAGKYGLPRAIAFTKATSGLATLKALSIEYRRKILIGVVKGTKNNQSIMKKYNVKDLPAFLVWKVDDTEPQIFPPAKKPSHNALSMYLSKFALKKEVYGQKKAEESESEQSGGEGAGKEKGEL